MVYKKEGWELRAKHPIDSYTYAARLAQWDKRRSAE